VSESTRGRRKSLVGTVVSVKMDKTAVVSVERRYPHQLYHKIIRSTKRYKAHDPENAAVLGDTVRIVETRPISKEKRWRIAETMVRGNVADVAPREIGAPEEALAPAAAPVAPEAPAAAAVVATGLAADRAASTPVVTPEALVASEPAPAEATAPAEPEASVEETPVATELAADEAEASNEEQPEAAAETKATEEKGT
jgi:small subunit ribosomal protein S17